MAAEVATITVTILATEVFERWCDRCLNTEPHVRVYMRIGKDASVKVFCGGCEVEDA